MSGRMTIAAISNVTFLVKGACVPRNVGSTSRIDEALRYHRRWSSSMKPACWKGLW